MIIKFRTGRHARRLLDYISAGSDLATPMFSNMAGSTPVEMAREVAALSSLRPKLGKAVGHLILSHDPGQRELTDSDWREALDIALAGHGAQSVPFAAWLHVDKAHVHLHVFLLRITAAGNVITDSNSFRKNERAARAIEQRLGLGGPKPRAPEDRHPSTSNASAERGRRRFERLASYQPHPHHSTKGAPRVIDPSPIFSAIDEAENASLNDLKMRLAQRGIEAQFIQGPGAAEPKGWRLRQAGPAGTWVKGSDVNRNLSLKKVQERIRENLKRRPNLSVSDPRNDEAPVHWIHRSSGSFMALPFAVEIRLVAGLINAIGHALACRIKVPADALGWFDVDADGSTHFIDPVDLSADASDDKRADLEFARTEMCKFLDQATEAILKSDISLLPSAAELEVMEERTKIIRQLEETDRDNEPQRVHVRQ